MDTALVHRGCFLPSHTVVLLSMGQSIHGLPISPALFFLNPLTLFHDFLCHTPHWMEEINSMVLW